MSNFFKLTETTNEKFKYLEGSVGTIRPYFTAILYETTDKYLTTSSIVEVIEDDFKVIYKTLNSVYTFEKLGESVSLEEYFSKNQ